MTKEQIISYLAAEFKGDNFHFDFQCSMLLSGDSNKALRQELMRDLTGSPVPATKCGLTALTIQLKNKFNQPTLF